MYAYRTPRAVRCQAVLCFYLALSSTSYTRDLLNRSKTNVGAFVFNRGCTYEKRRGGVSGLTRRNGFPTCICRVSNVKFKHSKTTADAVRKPGRLCDPASFLHSSQLYESPATARLLGLFVGLAPLVSGDAASIPAQAPHDSATASPAPRRFVPRTPPPGDLTGHHRSDRTAARRRGPKLRRSRSVRHHRPRRQKQRAFDALSLDVPACG
jgi:hypothetical protein